MNETIIYFIVGLLCLYLDKEMYAYGGRYEISRAIVIVVIWPVWFFLMPIQALVEAYLYHDEEE